MRQLVPKRNKFKSRACAKSDVLLDQTNHFLTSNRRKVLEGKGQVSHADALEKAEKEYAVFRIRQDQEYISEFDRQTEKYLKGE